MNYEIDTMKILKRLLRYSWILILALLAGAAAGYFYTSQYKPDTYTAQTSLIVQSSQKTEEISQTQLTASEKLVDTCIAILNSDAVIKKDVINVTGLPYTEKEIREMTSMSAENDTQILRISVTGLSAKEVTQIAKAFSEYGSQTVMEKLEGGFIKILDDATVPEQPNSKGIIRNMALAGFVLALLCAGIIVVITMFDTRIKSEEDMQLVRGDVPIIGAIPSFSQVLGRGGRAGAYSYESTSSESEEV